MMSMLRTIVQGDHSACAKPPVDFKTKVPLWPGQARPSQSRTFVLKSAGGFAQAEWSPCNAFVTMWPEVKSLWAWAGPDAEVPES